MAAPDSRRQQGLLSIAGATLAAVALLLALVDARAALTGWLGAAVFAQAIPFGALVLLLMMRLVRGKWEEDLRAPARACAMLLPIAAIGFLPVIAGMAAIYPWFAVPPESAFARAWLTPLFFALRSALWFLLLGFVTRRALAGPLSEGFAAAMLIVLVPLGSLLAVDWLMSLDPDFASSGFGLQLLALGICTAFAVMLSMRLAAGAPRHPGVLGGLLLTLLLLWAYFQFMPFFVSWSGNLPSTAGWYLARATPGWNAALALAAALGGIPLFALFSPEVRRSPAWLGRLARMVLAGKAIEFAWLAIPGRGTVAVVSFALSLAALACLMLVGLKIALRRTDPEAAP